MKTKDGEIGDWKYTVRGRSMQEILMFGQVDKIAAQASKGDPQGELELNARLTASIIARCIIGSTGNDNINKILSLEAHEFERLKDDIASCENLEEAVSKNSKPSCEASKQPALLPILQRI